MPSELLSHFHKVETSSRVLEEKSNLERLGQKVGEAEGVQAAHSDMDPPALSLPVEVTSLVFRYLVGSDDQLAIEPHFPSSLNSRRPYKHVGFLMEVILSHVCRLWRSIALDLPTLWSTYRYDSYIFYPPGPSLNRLQAYLERSRSRLVDLKFDFRIAQGNSHYDCGSRLQMLAKIMAHVTRWRRVFIITDKNTPILDLLDNFKKVSAPNLEHFSVRMGSYGATTRQIQDLQPVLFKGGAPKLSSVAVDYLNHLVLSPLSKITTLRIEQPKLNTKWELLSSDAFINILLIPTLTNLSLVGDIGVLVYVEDFEDIIYMRSLKHLRLADGWSMSTILPYLRAPLLETLILRNWYPEGFSTPDYNYSFPSLHTLAFEQSSDYDSEYPDLVSWDSDDIFRSLSILTKHAVYVAFSHFSSLERAFLFPHHQAFWPDLQVINFNVKYSTRIDDYLIFAIARANLKKPRFTLRIHNELIKRWRVEAPNALGELKRACNVEAMATGAMSAALISNRPWPPTFDDAIPDDDLLEIDADDHLNLQRDIYHSQIRATWKYEVF
jgi:F-box-like